MTPQKLEKKQGKFTLRVFATDNAYKGTYVGTYILTNIGFYVGFLNISISQDKKLILYIYIIFNFSQL